jgi:glycosyltransferase involved in cell wall biosynthesis
MAPLAIYIGHISYGSEVSLVIEALPRVLKSVPGLCVVMVGSGSGIEALQQLARTADVTERLIFTGWVDPVETPVYLATADLALYPYRDTLINRAKSPSKITAYMAMGRPIVASAVGENVEYLDNGNAGILVEPGNADAFADGMIKLLRDPGRAEEFGRRAERRIWERYDWARQVEKVEGAYRAAAHTPVSTLGEKSG